MSEFDQTPDAFRSRLAGLIELAKARGYDGIDEREAPATSSTFYVKRGNRIVAAFSDLDMLERYPARLINLS